jgi:hypothetical protein
VVLRWFLPVAVMLLALSADGSGASAASNGSPSNLSGLALAGVSGSFDEVYQVVGAGGSGTVEVAQKARPGHRPFVTGSGEWSFVYQTHTGFSFQWIEKGSESWNCWRRTDAATWTCSGPGHFEASNGFFLAIQPYIPGVVLDDVEELQQALKTKPSPVKGISLFGSNSTSFGPLRCVKVAAVGLGLPISSCFDVHGILVTQQGGSYWTTVTLARYGSTVLRSAFQLKGTSKSSGRNFELGPII